MKFFCKKRLPNGRRHIYLCGVKIASYGCKEQSVQNLCSGITAQQAVRYCGADRLPALLRDRFYERTGKLPTEYLETFSEKIIWASMFDVTQLKIQCADKLAVRDYVIKTIGDKYLPQLYAVYKNSDEFDIEKLPQSFVLTYNAGSGQNIVIPDKSSVAPKHLKQVIRQWLLYNHSEPFCEMQYRYIPPRVIAREMVDIRTDIEYKLFCFGGKVEFIKLVSYEYGHKKIGSAHYDTEWNNLGFFSSGGERYAIQQEIQKPAFLAELVIIAEKLAEPFDFVRVDFYETKDGKLMFGELTFSPSAGFLKFTPDNDTMQKRYGKMFKIPPRDENGFAVRKK